MGQVVPMHLVPSLCHVGQQPGRAEVESIAAALSYLNSWKHPCLLCYFFPSLFISIYLLFFLSLFLFLLVFLCLSCIPSFYLSFFLFFFLSFFLSWLEV